MSEPSLVASRAPARLRLRVCVCACFFFFFFFFFLPPTGAVVSTSGRICTASYLFAFRPASNMERALNVYRVYTRRVRDDGSLTARAADRARYYVVRGGKGELSGQRPACTRLRVLTPTSCLSSSRNCTLRPAISPFFFPARRAYRLYPRPLRGGWEWGDEAWAMHRARFPTRYNRRSLSRPMRRNSRELSRGSPRRRPVSVRCPTECFLNLHPNFIYVHRFALKSPGNSRCRSLGKFFSNRNQTWWDKEEGSAKMERSDFPTFVLFFFFLFFFFIRSVAMLGFASGNVREKFCRFDPTSSFEELITNRWADQGRVLDS